MSKVTDINYYKRRKRRKAGNSRWILLIVFLITCAVGGYFFALSPYFFITDIEVSGNTTVNEDSILDLSGVERGKNIFTVDLYKTKQMIMIDPKIRDCRIIRSLPDKLTINVEEREAVAIIPTGSGFLYIDSEGVVLVRYQEVAEIPLPLLVGIGDFLPGSVPGTRIDSERLDIALDIIAQIDPEEEQMIDEINVGDEQKIILYVTGGTKVTIGDMNDFTTKYQIMEKILTELKNNGKIDSIHYIDVSITEKPVIYYK